MCLEIGGWIKEVKKMSDYKILLKAIIKILDGKYKQYNTYQDAAAKQLVDHTPEGFDIEKWFMENPDPDGDMIALRHRESRAIKQFIGQLQYELNELMEGE